MCHPPTCVYRVYIAACCVICLIGAVTVIAIGMAQAFRMGEESVYNFKENRPKGVPVSDEDRQKMAEVKSHFKHITTSLTGSGIISGTISMIGGYGACCNLAMALYLFMVGVAMLVIAEVATGSVVYYKQSLISETLTEFRNSDICGTICFLDDLVSRQLMAAVIVVIGMTVLQIGQIVCAYCIVRRLSTPKPVKNIQSAVQRIMRNSFFAVARHAVPAPSPAPTINNSSEDSPAPGPRHPSILAPALVNSANKPSTRDQGTPSDPPPMPTQKAIMVSEGAQTDDLEELRRPLLAEQAPAHNPSSSSKPCDVELVEIVEESIGQQKSCIRYAASTDSDGVRVRVRQGEALQVSHVSNGEASANQCTVAVDVVSQVAADSATSPSGYQSSSVTASDSTATDVMPSVVVKPSLSSSSHHQPHATRLLPAKSVVPTQPARNAEFTAADATIVTHQASSSSRGGRVAKLIPSTLPAPHFVRKLNDFSEIQRPQVQHGSPSPTSRKRHLLIPIAPSAPCHPERQHSHHFQPSFPSTAPRPCVHTSTPSDLPEVSRSPVVQTLRFADLPPPAFVSANPCSNMAKRKARSYTSVENTASEAYEAADYIDLRELRRSPGTPGPLSRSRHFRSPNTVICSHQQQHPIFPQQAHAPGAYPDKSQWRLPQIRTLYVSYV